MAEGCPEEKEQKDEEKRRRGEGLSRIESELDLRLGIKTFETSTGQQDRLQLNHSSSLVSSSIPPSRLSDVPSLPPPPFPFPLVVHLFLLRLFWRLPPFAPFSPASTSSPLVPLLTVSAWTHRTRDPLSGFFGARLLPFAPPLSRPDLGASRLHVACPNDVSERTGGYHRHLTRDFFTFQC